MSGHSGLLYFSLTLLAMLNCGTLFHQLASRFPATKRCRIGVCLLAGLLTTVALWASTFPTSPTLSSWFPFLVIGPCVYLTWTDFTSLKIPDVVNQLIGALGVVYLALAPERLVQGVSCAGLLFACFFLIALLTKGGMGGGDVKFVGAIGFFFTFSHLFPFLLIATFTASCYGGVLLLWRRRSCAFAFGPFLSLAAYVCLFFL